MYVQEPAIQSGIVALNSFVNPTISEKLAPTPEMSVNLMQCIIWGITVFWIAGMTIMIVYGLISYLQLHHRICAGVYDAQKKIWRCDYISTPFILGVFRPRIYLPSSILKEDEAYVIDMRGHI